MKIWLETAETASRVCQRVGAVLQWGWAHGHITANPVSMVDHLLPKQKAKKEHQPAMPWREVPEFAKAQLRDIEPGDSTRAAFLFLILTAARSGEGAARRGANSTSTPVSGRFPANA